MPFDPPTILSFISLIVSLTCTLLLFLANKNLQHQLLEKSINKNFTQLIWMKKFDLLSNLLSNRSNSSGIENLKYLNQVISIFNDSTGVMHSFENYSGCCANPAHNIGDSTKLYNSMLKSMFENLGLEKNLFYGAIERTLN